MRFASCVVPRQNAVDTVKGANARDVFGFVGLGVGAAALGLGVVLLVTSNDPARYDKKPEAASATDVKWMPTLWTSRGGGGVGVVGAF